MSRNHRQDEFYTGMSGSFFVGAGDQFDDDRRLVRSDESGVRSERSPNYEIAPRMVSNRRNPVREPIFNNSSNALR